MPIVLNGSGAVTGLTTLPDSAMASGSVIQVVSTTKTDVFSESLYNSIHSSSLKEFLFSRNWIFILSDFSNISPLK